MLTDTRRWWSGYLHPRFWPLWLMFALLWLITRLPNGLQHLSGRVIGLLALALAGQRRRIAAVNLRLCFPELDAPDRAALLRAHFEALGHGVVETALCWWGSERRLRRRYQLVGEHHLQTALAQGNGVILLSAHFTTLELGGRLLACTQPFHVLYRRHGNPLFEAVMQRARQQRFSSAIARSDMRRVLQRLRDNQAVWFAPDQNHAGSQAVFAPFFGIPAATLTSTSRLARLSGAAVVPFFQMRLPGNGGYLLLLCPALEDFPGTDPATDATRINRLIEGVIREMPAQYLWVHRRFKTRPDGGASPYTTPSASG